MLLTAAVLNASRSVFAVARPTRWCSSRSPERRRMWSSAAAEAGSIAAYTGASSAPVDDHVGRRDRVVARHVAVFARHPALDPRAPRFPPSRWTPRARRTAYGASTHTRT